MNNMTSKPYVGRFAPSPSGPLHFGSLIAALGSYLQAKSQQGSWLVRIEDIDPPREIPGAADAILRTLDSHGLHWDGELVYQSDRLETYQAQIDRWIESGDAYYCQCTRKQIKESGGFYAGTCRDLSLSPDGTAVRLKVDKPVLEFQDILHGSTPIPEQLAWEDFIIRRRDGLFAYNLAVVLDDIEAGITEVVRGADLIEPTGRQVFLYHKLGATPVSYLHLPLATGEDGGKLSKQNHAPAIDNRLAGHNLCHAMRFLGLNPYAGLAHASPTEILAWGTENWSLSTIPKNTSIIAPF